MVTTIENRPARPVLIAANAPVVNPALPPLDSYWSPQRETIRERVKLQLLHQISNFAGLLRPVLGRLAKSSVSVLTYHRIAPRCNGVPFPTINVTPETFRAQLQGLKRSGFQFGSLSSVLDACEAAGDGGVPDLPERTVVVTFDDIYDNVFQHAWPVLQELNIPVTFFVSTAFIDSPEPFLFDPWAQQHRDAVPEEAWLPITDAHLRTMLDTGLAELGAHTDTHQDFRNRPQAFAADMAIGVQKLRHRYKVERLPFAFPYGIPRMGFTAEALMDVTKGLGLRCGLSTGGNTNKLTSSPFGWGRFHVFQHDNSRSLAAKIDGWYEWLPKIKNILTRKIKPSIAE
jgi:hypothetical protein